MLAVTGFRTSIVAELMRLIGDEETVRISSDLARADAPFAVPPYADKFVLAAGCLYNKRMVMQTPSEIIRSLCINLVNVIRLCEQILVTNENARICVIGSQSGVDWSFDDTYAAAKAAVHKYVETRKTHFPQQLICVAPTIIRDSGMTRRREDYPGVLEKRTTVSAKEVAQSIHKYLWGDERVSNIVENITC